MKKFLLPLLGMLLLLALSACVAPPPVNQLWCPINYDTTKAECVDAVVNPDPVLWEPQKALSLATQDQVALFVPPGDAPIKIVRGIGSHRIPEKYAVIYYENPRTLRALKDKNFCPKEELDLGECDVTLDNVRLLGAVLAKYDYEITFEIVVNSETAPILAKIGGHKALVTKMNNFLRGDFRVAPLDPALFPQGKLDAELIVLDTSKLAKWEYASLVKIKSVAIRSLSVQGYEAKPQDLQVDQGNKAASAFATQQAIACPYKEEAWRAYCMAVYVWSQKQEGALPQPPVGQPTVVTPGPTAKP